MNIGFGIAGHHHAGQGVDRAIQIARAGEVNRCRRHVHRLATTQKAAAATLQIAGSQIDRRDAGDLDTSRGIGCLHIAIGVCQQGFGRAVVYLNFWQNFCTGQARQGGIRLRCCSVCCKGVITPQVGIPGTYQIQGVANDPAAHKAAIESYAVGHAQSGCAAVIGCWRAHQVDADLTLHETRRDRQTGRCGQCGRGYQRSRSAACCR